MSNTPFKAVLGAALLALALPVAAQTQADSEEALLDKVRTGNVGQRAETQRRMADFRRASPERKQQMLENARRARDAMAARSQELEQQTRANDRVYQDKINQLRDELGENAILFGILQQTATDLIGIFRNSPTTLEIEGREAWLTAFKGRMETASEIFTIRELETLWYMVQQEATASGRIAKVQAEVLGESGTRERREIVRVGKFNLITDEPRPAYLTWQAETQRVSVLGRQPDGPWLNRIGAYMDNSSGVASLGIDSTGGSLLTRLVDAPSLRDRIDQGGLPGYVILAMGAFGALVAVIKLLSITFTSIRVGAQRRKLDQPSAGNPLGRMLRVYEDNKAIEALRLASAPANAAMAIDTETLEMRLGEALLEERPRIDRFVNLIKIIAAVAPLMGLLGTVIGMIATFQSITLFGTGDPKTMAGGISQALVTTVLGLVVAIPMVLLHAVVSARANALINLLKHQTAGLIAERMEADAAGQASGAQQ